ncbi:hypothetical protein ACFE04_015074 [Oxalis oulophora]
MPCLDGRYLLLGPDKELNHSEIAKLSKRDADAYPMFVNLNAADSYEQQLEKFCEFMDPLLDSAPPESSSSQGMTSFSDRLKDRVHKSAFWARILLQAASLGQKEMVMASRSKIYIVIEFIDGGELFDQICGRLKEDEARRYFQQLINVVDYCHSRGVYHRDLKPENLLLNSFGVLKISDFGLSALSQQVRIVECNALLTLVLMLQYLDTAIYYEAVSSR